MWLIALSLVLCATIVTMAIGYERLATISSEQARERTVEMLTCKSRNAARQAITATNRRMFDALLAAAEAERQLSRVTDHREIRDKAVRTFEMTAASLPSYPQIDCKEFVDHPDRYTAPPARGFGR